MGRGEKCAPLPGSDVRLLLNMNLYPCTAPSPIGTCCVKRRSKRPRPARQLAGKIHALGEENELADTRNPNAVGICHAAPPRVADVPRRRIVALHERPLQQARGVERTAGLHLLARAVTGGAPQEISIHRRDINDWVSQWVSTRWLRG